MEKEELDLLKLMICNNEDSMLLFDYIVRHYPNITDGELEVLRAICEYGDNENEIFCLQDDEVRTLSTFEFLRSHPEMKVHVCSSYSEVVSILPNALLEIFGENPSEDRIYFGTKYDAKNLTLNEQIYYFGGYFRYYGHTFKYRPNLNFAICAPLTINRDKDKNLYIVLTK